MLRATPPIPIGDSLYHVTVADRDVVICCRRPGEAAWTVASHGWWDGERIVGCDIGDDLVLKLQGAVALYGVHASKGPCV